MKKNIKKEEITSTVKKSDFVLEVKNISITMQKKKILDNVSFSLPHGVLCAFIGSNGSGKTTTIRSIIGLYNIDEGEVFINGISIKNHKALNGVGYLPEKETFTKVKTINWLIELAQLSGLKYSDAYNKINELATELNIAKCLNMRMIDLSSGQRKKILLIQALVHNPDFLVMDEPTENLDPEARKDFYDTIANQVKKGKAVLISTHVLDEIGGHADYAVLIKEGKVTQPYKVDRNVNKLKDIYYKHAGSKITEAEASSGKTEPEKVVSKNNSHDDFIKQLKELKGLVDNGALTKEEFAKGLYECGILTKEEFQKRKK